MSDVTALVLTVGEDSTARAIASTEDQTLPVAETIVVRDISPFHRAFNNGAARVRTPFFIQVDADMVLDTTCVEELRNAVRDTVGVVVGHLRDPLVGRLRGIKLFRTACCARVSLRDSPSPETDFNEDILPYGWRTIYALKSTTEPPPTWHVFGSHCPDYTFAYTFSKYLREGAKARYRQVGTRLRGTFQQLRHSAHPAAMIAVIASAHGIFVDADRDIQAPDEHSDSCRFLERFFEDLPAREHAPPISADLAQTDLRRGFQCGYELGNRLRHLPAPDAFRTSVRQLQQANDLASWVALVGLCHGLFVEEYRQAEVDGAFSVLGDLLPAAIDKMQRGR